MNTQQGTMIVENGQLIDGTGDTGRGRRGGGDPRRADCFCRPRRQTRPSSRPTPRGSTPGAGTIMPGLVEAHFHPTYFNVAALQDLDIKYPVEYVTLLAAANARLALECGYTAARSGGSLFNIDVWLKKAIEEDLTPGPTAGRQRTRNLRRRRLDGLESRLSQDRHGRAGLARSTEPKKDARAVRKLVKDGVEWVKTYPTGDAAAPDTNDHHTLCMTFEEMHAVVAEAHNHRLKVTGHCRATEGIKNALRAGYDTLEHGTFMDAEALDMLLARNTPVVPALQFEYASVERGPEFKLPQAVIDGHQETLEGGRRIGAHDPPRRRTDRHGGRLRLRLESARRLCQGDQLLRQLRRLHAARSRFARPRKTGAEIMGRADEFGTVEAGKLADLLVIDGDRSGRHSRAGRPPAIHRRDARGRGQSGPFEANVRE